jgi:hypothetical protein
MCPAPVLWAGGQDGGLDGGTLRPGQTIQTHGQTAQIPTHASGPDDPEYTAQNRRE